LQSRIKIKIVVQFSSDEYKITYYHYGVCLLTEDHPIHDHSGTAFSHRLRYGKNNIHKSIIVPADAEQEHLWIVSCIILTPHGVRSDFVSPGDRTAVKSGEKIGQLSLFDLAFAGMNHYETAYTHVPHR